MDRTITDIASGAEAGRAHASGARFLRRAVLALVLGTSLGAAATDSTGLLPLNELGAGAHDGQQGGLYPGGGNEMPAAHRAAGLARARQIRPLDAAGEPAADGRVVLLGIGMSSTTQHYRAFMNLARDDERIHQRAVLVNGAQPGQSADRTADPDAGYWQVVDSRLAEKGVTAAQVQAVWMKQATPFPREPFPAEAQRLQRLLQANVQNLAAKFPNLKIAYLSDHIYGGYTESGLNPEPFAYEIGFAVKWLIADQIAGSADLNYDAARGPVRAPWLSWGPYVWGDGVTARADGVRFLREDFAADGSHPSPSGEQKVARLLLDFLLDEPTAQPWFLSAPASAIVDQSWGQAKRIPAWSSP